MLCDDEYMAAVNNEWRGQNRPTDVLSFEIPHDEFTAVCLLPHACSTHGTVPGTAPQFSAASTCRIFPW